MCSNVLEDEERFISLINAAIISQEVTSFPQWTKDSKDTKARNKRKAEAKSEAKEAEELAKELGLHDKLFGKKDVQENQAPGNTSKKTKGKKTKVNEDGVDEDALKALIQSRNSKNNTMNSLIEKLEAKYGTETVEEEDAIFEKGGKKAGGAAGKKRASKSVQQPTEEEFEALQKKLFNGKNGEDEPASKKAKKSRKA